MSTSRFAALVVITLVIGSCSSGPAHYGIDRATGFRELRFPQNELAPGQIVQYFSAEDRASVIFDPKITGAVTESRSPTVSGYWATNLKSSLGLSVQNVVKANLGVNYDVSVEITLKETKTRTIESYVIFGELGEQITRDDRLREYLRSSLVKLDGVDVITSVLIADIEMQLRDDSGVALPVSAPLAESISGELGFALSNTTGTAIGGKQLVVGFHSDPHMLEMALESIEE